MTEIELLRRTLDCLEAMRKEFRELDLPYGSKAYCESNYVVNELRKVLDNLQYP